MKIEREGKLQDITFKVIYSRRRSIGISVLPDSSVIVRVPLRTPDKTINRIVTGKADWIIKHRENYRILEVKKIKRPYSDGASHLFRGRELLLKIAKSNKSSIKFDGSTIELGLLKSSDPDAVKSLLYKGYKNEALILFPEMFTTLLQKHGGQKFSPAGLIIRTMKRRWGSCSSKGIITLSTELIKLPDIFIEYVIIHEMCHLRHHNHGPKFYELLSEVFPDWKPVRKELKKYIFTE